MKTGKVYLVGAGPGDVGLITVRGLELLGRADCVIYDGLANSILLEHVRPEAETINVQKRTGDHPVKQDQINILLIEKAQQGKCVVRLKGGDPCLFGRAAEEVRACVAAGVAFEIVPGVTSGMAAAEYAGIFLTNRDNASAVAFITGRQAEGKTDSGIDWYSLSAFRGALVFYMAMGTLQEIAQRLIEHGKDKKTQVSVIHHATLPQQRIIEGDLENIAGQCEIAKVAAPSIVIIGPGAKTDANANWFMQQPLFGKRVLVTRDVEGNRKFAQVLTRCGAQPVAFEGIELISLAETPQVQQTLERLGSYDWVVFTSANGVSAAFEGLAVMKLDARAFGGGRIACIGEQTAQRLRVYGITADFVPSAFTSAALAEELNIVDDLNGKRILLLRSKIAPKDFPERLISMRAQVTDTAVYTVQSRKADAHEAEELKEQLIADRIDWLTFTSSSTVRAFLDTVTIDCVKACKIKIASIGPATTMYLKSLGLTVTCQARIHTVEGLVEEMSCVEGNR
jgi:uroporphyrinogen III methyltransferase/synthase